jgi:hypothetical protein
MIALLPLVSPILLLVGFVGAQTCTPCQDVHIFLARGNNEPYPGRQGTLVAAICEGVDSCGYEDLIYSALYTDLSCQTTYDGTVAGHTQLTSYADRCPNSKLILAGYSQGAQIVTDILGGGGGISFNGCVQPNTAPLDRATSPGNRLSAVLAIGNTRHTANQPYNYGNGSAFDGLFPKSGAQLSAITAYTDITRDWCVSTDPICAANQTFSDVSTHLGYYDVYAQEAAAWIKGVASITADSNFHTVIPTHVSGTVEDYSTVGTATPSGTVTTATITTATVQCGSSTSSSSTRATSSSVASQTPSASSDANLEGAVTSAPSASATASDSASDATSWIQGSRYLSHVTALLFSSLFLVI